MVCAAMRPQPLALGSRPVARRQHLLQRPIHALLVRHQRVAGRQVADKADDMRGDVLVGHLAPGGRDAALAEPGPVQFQRQLAQLLAGQVARAGQHGQQGRDAIAVGAGCTP